MYCPSPQLNNDMFHDVCIVDIRSYFTCVGIRLYLYVRQWTCIFVTCDLRQQREGASLSTCTCSSCTSQPCKLESKNKNVFWSGTITFLEPNWTRKLRIVFFITSRRSFMVSGAADIEERRMERKDGSGITFISSSFLHVRFSNRTSKPLGRSIEGLKKQPTPK